MSKISRMSVDNFLSLQPEFELKTEYYVEFMETDSTNQASFLFYQFKIKNDSTNLISLIPDGCIDILFYCDLQNPSAHIYGSVSQRKLIQLKSNSAYFGVRFLPKHELHKFNFSLREMINNVVPLIEMFSIDCSVVEKIIYEMSFYERIDWFKRMVGNFIFTYKPIPSIVGFAIDRIYTSRGNININLLAEETNFSTRYIRKQFEEYIGISPKLFSQIVRFQYSLYMLTKLDDFSIKDIICENGYYDQAHMIHEFKKFGYLTPKRLLKGKLAGDVLNKELVTK